MEEVEVDQTHSPKTYSCRKMELLIEFQEDGSAQCTCHICTTYQKNWKHVLTEKIKNMCQMVFGEEPG